ncbi:hypothetical protein BASA60_009307 [Batrachochytrium salamandrivorans]|nr:hypothetical protein BASA60_009307 [Batrachochytrium salamandrivorans]
MVMIPSQTPLLLPSTAVLFAFLLLKVHGAPPDKSKYPETSRSPPGNANWSANILKDIPHQPPNEKPLTSTDWSMDVTACKSNSQWGLSFDDGPGAFTDHLLGELKQRNVTASFFIVGREALANPEVLLRTYQAGHHIDGDIDQRVRSILLKMGLTVASWNMDPNDAGGAKDVAQQFSRRANAGNSPVISLQHDLFVEAERQAGPAMDAVSAGSGQYKMMSIDRCINVAPYSEALWSLIEGKPVPADNGNGTPATHPPGSPTTSTNTTQGGGSNQGSQEGKKNLALSMSVSIPICILGVISSLLLV